MSKFRPIEYLKKYAGLIIVFFVLLTVGLHVFLRKQQTYTAAVVIEYVYSGAEEGLAPDCSKLDITGIYSSDVISQALSNLGLKQSKYPIDSIRAAIAVEELEDESVTLVKEALNKVGEATDLRSTKYSISYTVDSSEGGNFACSVLEEILDVYFTQFSKRYINTSTIVNGTSAINTMSYDYMEQVELIEASLQQTTGSLSKRAAADPVFYSAATGYSFNELADRFTLLQNTQVSSLYAYILDHQVTKDKEALLSKYEQRVNAYSLEQKKSQIRLDEVEGVLSAYVEKMRDSGETESAWGEDSSSYSQNNDIMTQMVNPNYVMEEDQKVSVDQTTEYEKLLQSWIEISDGYHTSTVNAAYAQYIIDCFSGNTEGIIWYQESINRRAGALAPEMIMDSELAPEEPLAEGDAGTIRETTAAAAPAGTIPETTAAAVPGGTTPETTAAAVPGGTTPGTPTGTTLETPESLTGAADPETGISEAQPEGEADTQMSQSCTPEDVEWVETKINDLLTSMNTLYDVAAKTDAEYNEYLGAEYIDIISSSHVTKKLKVMLYTLVGAVLFLVIGSLSVILLGRAGDMIEYMAFTDHQYRMPNRAACDRHIEKYNKKVLPTGYGCMIFHVMNQGELNQVLGRKRGDEALAYFASGLETLFDKRGTFTGYNGSGQFLIFTQNTDLDELERGKENFRIMLEEHFKELGTVCKYFVGCVESSEANVYRIRDLLSKAMTSKVPFEAGIVTAPAGGNDEKVE